MAIERNDAEEREARVAAMVEEFRLARERTRTRKPLPSPDAATEASDPAEETSVVQESHVLDYRRR